MATNNKTQAPPPAPPAPPGGKPNPGLDDLAGRALEAETQRDRIAIENERLTVELEAREALIETQHAEIQGLRQQVGLAGPIADLIEWPAVRYRRRPDGEMEKRRFESLEEFMAVDEIDEQDWFDSPAKVSPAK